MSTFRLVCAGCGAPAPDPYPFRCPRAADLPDVDHVIAKVFDEGLCEWPDRLPEANPFLRYRELLYSFSSDPAVKATGGAPSSWARTVRQFDEAIFRLCGERFRVTPFRREKALGDALRCSARGSIWVKNETGNVSGSHKSRHLAGIMLYVLKFNPTEFSRPPLAIASCGNAALAAAVIARAAGWPLRTFIPPHANPRVVERLQQLGASTVTCPRQPGETGDPCYRRFHEALADGALPFCCQGPDNGLTIEGGETLAYEMADQLEGAALDAIVIQVGGGALASSCAQGFERAVALRRLPAMPRIYTVQTQGAAPLARAFDRLRVRAMQHGRRDALAYAAAHRSEFMWPWEREPQSIAGGILDDETYDWLAVAAGMLETGGRSIVVDERTLEEANRVGRETTGINVDHTGSAGLAGLMSLIAQGDITPDENVAVIFSGVRRAERQS